MSRQSGTGCARTSSRTKGRPVDPQPLVAWAAPIASTIIVTAATASINAKIASGERKRDAARAETDAKRAREAVWRDDVERRLDGQDEKINAILKGQTTQMRSDLIHRAHRYIDDLGCASLEEKDAFNDEYKDYCEICRAHGIQNSFVDRLAQQVMALPNRQSKED